MEDDAGVVGAVDGFGAADDLVAVGDAAAGGEDVVVAVAFVEFGAFDGGVMVGFSVEDELAVVEDGGGVGGHFADVEHVVASSGAGTCEGVDEVGVAVVVPEGAGVDPAFGLFHADDGGPVAGGILGFGHEDSEVGVSEDDVVGAVVVAEGGGPDAAR